MEWKIPDNSVILACPISICTRASFEDKLRQDKISQAEGRNHLCTCGKNKDILKERIRKYRNV